MIPDTGVPRIEDGLNLLTPSLGISLADMDDSPCKTNQSTVQPQTQTTQRITNGYGYERLMTYARLFFLRYKSIYSILLDFGYLLVPSYLLHTYFPSYTPYSVFIGPGPIRLSRPVSCGVKDPNAGFYMPLVLLNSAACQTLLSPR